MPQRDFVVTYTLDPAIREGSWICKRPSDQGPWVFVYFKDDPRHYVHYVLEILSTSRNGNSRQGRVAFVVEDVLKELLAALPNATWLRDQNGDPWARGLETSAGKFDAYFCPGSWGLARMIKFEPAEGSRFRSLKNELANWLETDDESEVDRAYATPFDPGVKPAPGKGEFVAWSMERIKELKKD